MLLKDIIRLIEEFAPPALQEDYDNSGLICGDKNAECTGVLCSLDCTEDVIQEAETLGCNLVISHHPILFGGIKRLTGSDFVQRTIIKSIRSNIAIYACHTNIDNVLLGVNGKICDKLGLKNAKILLPKAGNLRKLVTYVPPDHHERVLNALFAAGAGNIGNYDNCSFNTEGTGTFRGNESATPFIGEAGKLSREKETRIETIFPSYLQNPILEALFSNHPYEEVAYDIFVLNNSNSQTGSGMIAEFEKPATEIQLLELLKKTFAVPVVKHTRFTGKMIRTVALCGGSGRFLLKEAIKQNADAFITADFKYHEFFDADGQLLLADVGHYESEQFTPEIFYDLIRKKFSTFAVHLSKIPTNPVNYY